MKLLKILLIPLFLIFALIAAYFIFMYKFAPNLIKNYANNYVQTNYDHNLTINDLFINPFTFDISIINASLKDTNETNQSLVSFEKFQLDPNVLTYFTTDELVIDDINIKGLDINYNVDKKSKTNFDKLIEKIQMDNNETNETNQTKSDFNVYIKNIDLVDSNLTYEDKKNDMNLKIKEFTTNLKDIHSNDMNNTLSQKISFKIDDNTTFDIDSKLTLSPLKFEGGASIVDFHPKNYFSLVKDKVNFEVGDSTANIGFEFKILAEPELKFFINNGNIVLSNLEMFMNKKTIAKINNLAVQDLQLTYPLEKVTIRNVLVDKSYADLILKKDYRTNFNELIAKQKELKEDIEESAQKLANIEKEITNNKTDVKKVSLYVDSIDITDSNVDVTDENYNFKTNVNNISVNVKKISLDDNALMPYYLTFSIDDTNATARGGIGFSPFKLAMAYTINNFDLSKTNPYLSKYLNLDVKKGKLFTNADFSVDSKDLKLDSDFFLTDFEVNDNHNKTLTKAKDFTINNFIYSKNDNSLKIEDVNLTEPYIYFKVDKNKNLNLMKLVKNSDKKASSTQINKTKKATDKSKNFKFLVSNVTVNSGEVDFTDESLPVPFKANIAHLDGSVGKLDSNSSNVSIIDLGGTINEYGYAKIDGKVALQQPKKSLQLDMLFKNIDMADLSPYSMKYLGREINGGKLTFDLSYLIKNSNLKASNDISIYQMSFGSDYKSKDAKDLPLSLAIAVLEDRNGLINLDIPIEGNVDDPQFSIAPIIFKSFTNIITNVVTSPFRFLGSILGLDEDNLKAIEFEKGKSTILPPAKESLDAIVVALNKKPNLALKVEPTYSISDREYFKNEKFESEIKSYDSSLTQVEIYEKMYIKYIGGDKLEILKKSQNSTSDLFNNTKMSRLQISPS